MSPKSSAGKKRQRKKRPQRPLPSKAEILEFIQSSPNKVGKREIARAFHIKGGERIALKRILKEMAEEGLIAGTRKRLHSPDRLPSVAVIEIHSQDADGELIAAPTRWEGEGEAPRILVLPDNRMSGPPPGLGDRLLARLSAVDGTEDAGWSYEARPMKRLPREKEHFLGIYRSFGKNRAAILPVDRKHLKEWSVDDAAGAKDGELVRFETSRTGRYGLAKARITEVVGDPEAEGAQSLIAIHAHGLPHVFDARVLAETNALQPPGPEGREDLTKLPLITIDPADARDHDDAVWAAADDDPGNENGWVVIVAIADVATHVSPGSALDKEARKRGNSVYFPDQVVPMLPERISNDLCSLREKEIRPCLAVRMSFDASGHKRSHRFTRGLMRSAAKLSYAQAQSAINGHGDEQAEQLLETVLRPLWQAYAALARARVARAPLALDLPERKLLLDDNGHVRDVLIPERLDAHRLIEEFMIQANVAAAETLEKARSPLLYRVHDAPSKEKLAALGEILKSFDLKLLQAGVLKPEHFNHILDATRETPHAELVAEMVLRTQAQAEYSAGNYGHFGLNLRRYAHFTSPIRRYADLIVHRALIRALDLGPGGLTDAEIDELDGIADSISKSERRAMAAERETVDRLIAGYLADRVGSLFEGRISGVARSGLFVRLAPTGADGFVPGSAIGGDFYAHDERRQALVGERTGEEYRLGDQVEVRLIEAVPSAGALRLEMVSEGRKRDGKKPTKKARRGRERTRKRRR